MKGDFAYSFTVHRTGYGATVLCTCLDGMHDRRLWLIAERREVADALMAFFEAMEAQASLTIVSSGGSDG